LRQGLIRFNSSSQRGLLLAWISRLDPIKPAPASATAVSTHSTPSR
jgi:hypothetical protein